MLPYSEQPLPRNSKELGMKMNRAVENAKRINRMPPIVDIFQAEDGPYILISSLNMHMGVFSLTSKPPMS